MASIKSYDEYTLYHSVNLAVIAMGLGLAIGLPEAVRRELAMEGPPRPGEDRQPLEILRKPDLLDEDEWRVMRRDPVLGGRPPGPNARLEPPAHDRGLRALTCGTTTGGILSSGKTGLSTR